MSNTNTKIQVLCYSKLVNCMPLEDVKEVIESVEQSQQSEQEQPVLEMVKNNAQIFTPLVFQASSNGLRV